MNETWPQGWIKTTIVNVANIEMGQSPSGKATNTDKIGLPLIGGASDYEGHRLSPSRYTSEPTKICKIGDLVLCIRATIGNLAEADQIYCLGRGVAGIRTNIIEKKYLWHLISRDKKSLNEAGTGSTFRQIDKETLTNWPIHLPPLAEQKRIVAKLEALLTRSTNARNELAAIPKLIERYKQAVLAAAFRGDLTADWRGTSELMGWEKSTVGDIAKVGTGATPKRGESKYYLDGTHPWVTSGALNNDFIDSADEYITDQALKETNCTLYPANTILLAMYGEGKTRGKSSILRITASTNQACAAIQVTNSHVSIAFINYFFKFNYLNIRSEAAGGVQPNLNLSIVKAIELSIPPPSEQAIIIERIETAFKAIDTIQAELTQAEALRKRLEQATLAKAFKGKLVPQNPNDEPASVLLERIRAEREAQPKSKRTQRIKPAKEILSIQDELTVMVERSNLLNVIKGAGKPVTPEELLRGSIYSEDTIEDFYAALKLAVESKQIVEDREGDKILLRSSS